MAKAEEKVVLTEAQKRAIRKASKRLSIEYSSDSEDASITEDEDVTTAAATSFASKVHA